MSRDREPGDRQPGDRQPGDRQPGDRQPGDRQPGDRQPGDRQLRDRDPSGRPRNARPRDGLGRPLDHGDAGQDRIPDDLVITGRDAAVLADRLLRDGRPFHAHEVLEAAWKTGPPGERDLWQGLAQIAVGLTHARRGNARGAVTLLRRGTERVQAHQGYPDPYGMDIPAVLAAGSDLAARIEQHGLDQIPLADLSPGLLTGAV